MPNQVLANGRRAGKSAGIPQALVSRDLEQVEAILNQTLAPYRSAFTPLVNHLNHFRGKRLRPALLLLSARACGTVVPAHYILGAVVEMIHLATLVHDDVLDGADTRRHAGTFNAGWGDKVSILLGDLLFTTAFHLSSSVGDARACEWIGEATNRVCAGELRQTLERGNLELCEDDYLAMIEGKTAALTECCGRLGAFFAGADAEQVERLAGFGRDLGIAFQIADDVLDLVGSEQAAGKTLGTDLRQRKLTLPLIYLFERVSESEARDFRNALIREQSDFRALYEALRESGAVEAAQLRAGAFAEKARQALGELPATPYRTALDSIAEWAARRNA
jgi:octaprenyl-diphosphate synthase